MKNRVVAVGADTEQQREPSQLLELYNSGHCGVTVTANYDHTQRDRFQRAYAAAEPVKIGGSLKNN
ncbi:TPA: hypothetical protein ACIRVE_005084 [Pseudomonas putida]